MQSLACPAPHSVHGLHQDGGYYQDSFANQHSTHYATAGYPAITVPVGLLPDGKPMGITLIGKPGGDAALLAQAFAFEQASRLRPLPNGY